MSITGEQTQSYIHINKTNFVLSVTPVIGTQIY